MLPVQCMGPVALRILQAQQALPVPARRCRPHAMHAGHAVLCRKELLWPYIREFADRGIAHARRMLGTMAEAGRHCELYAVHGHYADAGEVAVLMSCTLDMPMVMTGHSLGRNKLENLLASGGQAGGRAGSAAKACG
jgi:hypothetical protein